MRYLGFDLGASSGKMMVGFLDGRRLKTEIIHRFANRQMWMAGGLYWDIISIYRNLEQGIKKAHREAEGTLFSVGIDSFCNDFGLIDAGGRLFNQVRCYRDERTGRHAAEIYGKVPERELYGRTGSQIALFNTSMQMASMAYEGEEFLLENCDCALLIPDLLGYLLTGEKHTEYTLASVTQLLDCRTGDWAGDLMDRLGIRRDIFPGLIETGAVAGTIRGESLAGAPGDVRVVAVAGHDTASAVAALPTDKEHVGYISSGTWSIVGTEVKEPRLTEEAYRANIAYEGGVGHRYRMIKNVMGLWILQECLADYREKYGRELSYGEVDRLVAEAGPWRFFIDPDDPEFYMPGNMLKKVSDYCVRTGQGPVDTVGAALRAVLEGLAFKYRMVFELLEKINGCRLEEIYILGGGGQNRTLNRFVAEACARPIYAGPFEAALAGNLIVQMESAGEVSGLKEGRGIIRDSFEIGEFYPGRERLWDEQYGKWKSIIAGKENG